MRGACGLLSAWLAAQVRHWADLLQAGALGGGGVPLPACAGHQRALLRAALLPRHGPAQAGALPGGPVLPSGSAPPPPSHEQPVLWLLNSALRVTHIGCNRLKLCRRGAGGDCRGPEEPAGTLRAGCRAVLHGPPAGGPPGAAGPQGDHSPCTCSDLSNCRQRNESRATRHWNTLLTSLTKWASLMTHE